ncbi:HEAT repeat domain-containing protein [Streptomyces olivaceiscleroticus]|uniref:HEAT repeat domain-containing protein n=1 Tax=Streptomyces olivaceiscleroticus TaxID=68245 RepID=A0ABP3KDJ0_9ACTN
MSKIIDDDDLVEKLIHIAGGPGCSRAERRRKVESQFPAVNERIASLMRMLAQRSDWSRFNTLENIAADLSDVPDLDRVLIDVVRSGQGAGYLEDHIEILGELAKPTAVDTIIQVFTEREDSDGPAYWLCLKCIQALGSIGTPPAREFLRSIAEGDHPPRLKWEAAVDLQIEDELGFDEDEMCD